MKGMETLEVLMNGKYLVTKDNPYNRKRVWKMEDDGLYYYRSKDNVWLLGTRALVWELMRIDFEEYDGESIPADAPTLHWREDVIKFMASKEDN